MELVDFARQNTGSLINDNLRNVSYYVKLGATV